MHVAQSRPTSLALVPCFTAQLHDHMDVYMYIHNAYVIYFICTVLQLHHLSSELPQFYVV